MQKNKVHKEHYAYDEDVREFTGLVFHCPNCDEVFHLHIATVRVYNQYGGNKNGKKSNSKI